MAGVAGTRPLGVRSRGIGGGVFVVVTLSRMYCKFRLREEDRHLRERIEQARLEIEREYGREVRETRRKLDDLAIRVIDREMALRSREETDAEEGDSQG